MRCRSKCFGYLNVNESLDLFHSIGLFWASKGVYPYRNPVCMGMCVSVCVFVYVCGCMCVYVCVFCPEGRWKSSKDTDKPVLISVCDSYPLKPPP